MKKNKHDHKGTKILKLGIFSTLMLAPFMAVLFKCAYVTFNKNAKDSYGGQVQAKYETNEVNNLSDLEVGNIYHFTIDSDVTVTTLTTLFRAKAVYNVPLQPNNNIYANIEADNVNSYFFVRINANGTISFPNQDYQGMINISNSYIQYPCEFDFVLYAYDNPSVLTADNFSASSYNVYENQYNAESTLDNAFYYAIDEAMESPYFAWARTSALYTATSGLTTGMGITTQAVPTLIVYWLVLTLIYIVLDIVIELFTFLTHNFMQRTE